jgi:hypothetical protein
MPGPTPYQYKPDDDPVTVAQQNGITPEQLIQANPGGYPFSAGQNINIPMLPPLVQNNINQRGRGYGGPYQYAQAPAAAPSLLQQRIDQGQQPQSRLGANYGPGYQMQPSINPPPSSAYGTDDSWYRPAAPAAGVITTPPGPAGATGNPNNGYGGFEPIRGGDNTDFANTAAARYNAANNIPFLQQSRWDPKRRKYISVGQWLRQNRRGGRGRGGGGKKPPEQKQQEFTLTNSFLDFNVSAG